jgi:hypothetical protein
VDVCLFCVCVCVCCVLSGTGLCDELITRPRVVLHSVYKLNRLW